MLCDARRLSKRTEARLEILAEVFDQFVKEEDLKPFDLELLSYFEAPPLQEAIGNRNVIKVLKAAIPIWKAETL